MAYNFDHITDRTGTNCLKYDFAAERGKPADILPLWVADMDFPVAEEIRETLVKSAEHGIFGYTDTKHSYFQAVADWMKNRHGWIIEEDWLVKTPGVVFGIAMAIRALTEPGDGVMIQNPVYYPFSEVIRDNDRRLVDQTLVEKNGRYEIDFHDFEEKIRTEQVKLFLLCSPHNPVGRVWSREELLKMGEICRRYGVVIVSDEIHHDFIYPGHTHHVTAALSPELGDITITCTAPSKTFNLAGLQVSNLLIGNPDLRARIKKEIAKAGYSQLNLFGLAACETAYQKGGQWFEEVWAYIGENLSFVRSFLEQELPELKLVEPEGTYLIWIDCRGLGLSTEALEELVVKKAGLWLDGGAIFGPGGAGFQRINIACPRAVLERALQKLAAAVHILDA